VKAGSWFWFQFLVFRWFQVPILILIFFPQNLKLMVEILNNQNWQKPGTSQQWFSHLV
jgi:hypothetical protein